MKLAIGLVIGFVLGASMAANASFYSADKILGQDRAYRLGYMAGAYDMIAAIKSVLDDGAVSGRDWVTRQFGCLDQRGDTLGPLTTWGESVWQANSSFTAGSVILDKACEGLR